MCGQAHIACVPGILRSIIDSLDWVYFYMAWDPIVCTDTLDPGEEHMY